MQTTNDWYIRNQWIYRNQKPQQIEELDKHIIGQRSAKVALAIVSAGQNARLKRCEIQPKKHTNDWPIKVVKPNLPENWRN